MYVEKEKNELFDYVKTNLGNFIVFLEDECVIDVPFDFKTSKRAGPTKIDLSDDQDLVYYLKLYLKIQTNVTLWQRSDLAGPQCHLDMVLDQIHCPNLNSLLKSVLIYIDIE